MKFYETNACDKAISLLKEAEKEIDNGLKASAKISITKAIKELNYAKLLDSHTDTPKPKTPLGETSAAIIPVKYKTNTNAAEDGDLFGSGHKPTTEYDYSMASVFPSQEEMEKEHKKIYG